MPSITHGGRFVQRWLLWWLRMLRRGPASVLLSPRLMLRGEHVGFWLWPGGMEVTESQLQILALAEEVERLQGLLAAERAARDELRRHALKLTAPRQHPLLTLTENDTADRPSASTLLHDEPPPSNPQPGASQPRTDKTQSAAIAERRDHVSVVHRVQHAGQSVAVDSTQEAAGRQRRSGFSLWGFITGEDRIRTS